MRLMALLGALALTCFALPAQAQYAKPGFKLPEDRRPSLLLVCPDLYIGQIDTHHMEGIHPPWTRAGHANLIAALQTGAVGQVYDVRAAQCDPTAEPGPLLAEARRIVSARDSDALFRVPEGTFPLPDNDLRRIKGLKGKKGQFSYGIGRDLAQRIKAAWGEADFALFIISHDSYSTPGEMAARIGGLFLGVPNHPPPHYMNSTLVDLSDGSIVWLKMDGGTSTDIRTPQGAAARVVEQFARMPGVAKARN
jgi:hypothetical protein